MSDTTRRQFLQVVTLAAGAASLGVPLSADATDAERALAQAGGTGWSDLGVDRAAFPQSVASGDPRSGSVILWTRVEPSLCGSAGARRIPVLVQVFRDDASPKPRSGTNRRPPPLVALQLLFAQADDDFCVKVRVTGLAAGARYTYRFLALNLRQRRIVASPTGRTRTASDAGSDVAVRFALLSCSDYIGRYYNTLLPLLDQDLDFVLHVGDYIYETTGDPSFQTPAPDRAVNFSDTAGAIALGTPAAPYYAAASVDNYRELYRAYRSDPLLQAVHERFPFITIWDDHEFSNDSWQANGTFFDGRRDELSVARKRNAESVYFEYMPLDLDDLGDGPASVRGRYPFAQQSDPDRAALYPDTRIYRQFRFGRHVSLVATDYRSFRPDHLIPEDAFPGAIAVDRARLEQVLALSGASYDAVKAGFAPYIDIEVAPWAALKPLLLAVAAAGYAQQGLSAPDAAAFAQKWVRGKLAVQVVNALIAQYNATVPPTAQVAPVSDAIAATLDRGLAYFLLGKTTLFGQLGARYLVVKDTYDLLAAARLLERGPSAQNAYGETQDRWFRTALAQADATFKLVATSVSFTTGVLDLRDPALQVPSPLNQRFYLNVDQWDGFPQQRAEYVRDVFSRAGRVVLLSGDIHASIATLHAPGVVEFTSPAVSSTTYASILGSGSGDPAAAALATRLLPFLETLLRSADPRIRYVQTKRNGAVLVEVNAQQVRATFRELPPEAVTQSYYANAAAAAALETQTGFVFDGSTLS